VGKCYHLRDRGDYSTWALVYEVLDSGQVIVLTCSVRGKIDPSEMDKPSWKNKVNPNSPFLVKTPTDGLTKGKQGFLRDLIGCDAVRVKEPEWSTWRGKKAALRVLEPIKK